MVGATYSVVVGATYSVVAGGTYSVVAGGTYSVVVGATYSVVEEFAETKVAPGCSVASSSVGSTSQSGSRPAFLCLPSADSSVVEQATTNSEAIIAPSKGSKESLLLLIETISLSKELLIATR